MYGDIKLAKQDDLNAKRKEQYKKIEMQKLMFPAYPCTDMNMYFLFADEKRIFDNVIELKKSEKVITNTYFNSIDISSWIKYTRIKNLFLEIEGKGKFELFVKVRLDIEHEEVILKEKLENSIRRKSIIEVPIINGATIVYWEIIAREETTIYNSSYFTYFFEKINNISLALNICTYKRKNQILNNLHKMENSMFFDKNTQLYGKMKIFVADNGNDLKYENLNEYIYIYPNHNKGGGTGGFTRGIEEAIHKNDEFSFSNIIFMDDDVDFFVESFYILYSFLEMLKESYKNRPIAGKMFRKDKPTIQYTAAEIWNGGNIFHINGNRDMSVDKNIMEEAISGEYGGWWLCVYPMNIAKENKPFPFFLHCDDVEYGLRQKNETINVKGFQVWHETYEYRITPKIIYYDIRNSLVINIVYNKRMSKENLIHSWKDRVIDYHNSNNLEQKYFALLAMQHFLKPKIFTSETGKVNELHFWLAKQKKFLKYIFPVWSRWIERKVNVKYSKMKKEYIDIIKNLRWRAEDEKN